MRRHVAGMDLGSERHWVCAPNADGASREIADFGATTPELMRMRKWLQDRHVGSVAMESTGVYWIAPHEVLEAAGCEILLVDTRQLAQVPGRDQKSDPSDCEWIQRMQKSLDQMNVRVHRAVSDIDGATGMAILRAIASGERDARKLAKLRDRRCRKSEEEIAEQLSGHWREEHLFSLRQGLRPGLRKAVPGDPGHSFKSQGQRTRL